MKYQDLAKATQDLLQGANVPAGKQNANVLKAIHDMLDGIQDGSLVVGRPVKEGPEDPRA